VVGLVVLFTLSLLVGFVVSGELDKMIKVN
jgi:hypothetical protein